MASGDRLREILELAKRELPDVPADVWERMEGVIRMNFGTERIYIAAHRKRSHLEQLAQADQNTDIERLSQMLGVSPRRVRQLRRLR